MVGGGTSTITASQAGDAGYNAATSKTFTITVSEYSPYSDSLPVMILWLDANDVNGDGLGGIRIGFCSGATSGVVSSWADRSGSVNSLAQSDATKMPAYQVNSGVVSLSFDGSNDSLSKSIPSTLTGNPHTALIAAKANSSGGQLMQLGSSTGTAGQVIGLTSAGAFDYNEDQSRRLQTSPLLLL